LINPYMRINGASSAAPSKITNEKGVAVLHYPTSQTRRIKLTANAPGYIETNINWTETFPKKYTFLLLPIGQN
jgi:hypothetical protein